MVAQCGFCSLVLVGRQIAEGDGFAGLDFGDQHFADVGDNGRSIHCALDDPGRD